MPDTGWTHVRHKTRRRPKHHNHNQTQTQSQPPSETFTPRTTNLRPASALEADYANFHSQWLDSPCRASLIRIIHDHTHTNTNTASPEITNAVCLGIGTFDPEDGGWETKRSAYMQLCAFTTLVSELGYTPFFFRIHPRKKWNYYIDIYSIQQTNCFSQQQKPLPTPP
jgi:hypothetical protein